MSTSTNRLRSVAALSLALALTALLAVPPVLAADREYVLDVVEGRLISGEHNIPLAEVETPIEVGVVGGEVIVRVQTPDGLLEENWGEGWPSLTERAVKYVDLLQSPARPTLDLADNDMCPVCGRSTAIGYHKQLPCGHWGCLHSVDHFRVCPHCEEYVCNGKVHTRCETCKVAWCVHVDLECEFTRNPAPTPYVTKEPLGDKVYYVVDPAGSSAVGMPGGKQAPTWAPGMSFVVTPKPSATDAP